MYIGITINASPVAISSEFSEITNQLKIINNMDTIKNITECRLRLNTKWAT